VDAYLIDLTGQHAQDIINAQSACLSQQAVDEECNQLRPGQTRRPSNVELMQIAV